MKKKTVTIARIPKNVINPRGVGPDFFLEGAAIWFSSFFTSLDSVLFILYTIENNSFPKLL
jgi:hypothetical protein